MHEDSLIVQPDANIYGNAAAMEDQVRAAQVKPVAIHCSAGVGRTGSLVSALVGMAKLKQDGNINLPTIVRHIRTQRNTMVQTVDQYDFAYHVLILWAKHLQSGAPLRKLMGGGDAAPTAGGMSVPTRRAKPQPVADDGPPVPQKTRESDGYVEVSGEEDDAPPALPSKAADGVTNDAFMEPSTQTRSSLRVSLTNDDGEMHGDSSDPPPFVRRASFSLDDPIAVLDIAQMEDDFEGLEL